MRIRQVKPAFWSDVRIADLPAPVRLFYIGLWMQADDAGWLRWDVPQIAAELYGFESRGRRERNVQVWGELLRGTERIDIRDCGHAHIPTLAEHQRLSGTTRQVLTITREHERECDDSPHIPADARTSPPGKELVRKGYRNGQGRSGTESAGARATKVAAPASEFDDRMAEHGYKP